MKLKTCQGGQKEIVIPKLIPKKKITITYLYVPPLTWDKVNTHLESDSGPIKILNVLPMVQLPKWLLWVLIGYGTIGVLYAFYEVYKWLL
jgi:hypothetical protein